MLDFRRLLRIAIPIIIVVVVLSVMGSGTAKLPFGVNFAGDENRNLYESSMGPDGAYKENLMGYNEIFPDELPTDAAIESLNFKHLNETHHCYLGYLVYTCGEGNFQDEVNRLKALDSSQDYEIYGIKSFPYELCAVYADQEKGIIYALADQENHRLIYVDLEFTDYYTDINYQETIDTDYLPEGFNAGEGNSVQLKMEMED